MVFITIVTRAYKPTYILGASHCRIRMAFMWKNDLETPRGSTISVYKQDLFIKKGFPTIGCFCNIPSGYLT